MGHPDRIEDLLKLISTPQKPGTALSDDKQQIAPSRRVLMIERDVPFARYICSYCYINGADFNALVKGSRQYERHYLAWETVRRGGNPFFEKGTGFEGYLVGTCHTPEAALHDLLTIGQGILDSIALRHRMEYGLHSRLMKTLVGEAYDPRALEIWSTQLGVILARLRCRALQNPEAAAFRLETYHAVDLLPSIIYHPINSTLHQTYFVDPYTVGSGHRMKVRNNILKPHEQDPWAVMHFIGQFGHPLLREFIERGSSHFSHFTAAA